MLWLLFSQLQIKNVSMKQVVVLKHKEQSNTLRTFELERLYNTNNLFFRVGLAVLW